LTKQLAQATSDWRTRFGIALVLLVATLGAVFVMQNRADATFSANTALTIEQAPPAPGPVEVGDIVTYTVRIVSDAGTGADTIQVSLDYDETALGWLDSWTGGGANCNSVFVFTPGTAVINFPIQAAQFNVTCALDFVVLGADTVDAAYQSDIDAPFAAATSGASFITSTLAASAGATLVQHPVNPIGVPHTQTFPLPQGFECGTDPFITGADGDCSDVGNVVITNTGANATLNAINESPDSVDVVLNASTLPGTTLVEVNITNGEGSAYTLQVVKTWLGLADFLEGAVIRHVDIDQGSEDAAGNPLGILDDPDDHDDAVSSRHVVCVFGEDGVSPGVLTAADNAFLTWVITATVETPNVNPSPGKISGDSLAALGGIDVGDVPCFAWSSTQTGDQTIIAVYDPDGPAGPVDGVAIYHSGTQPLIKEWNTIDETVIVAATGVLGPDNFGQNTVDFGNWVGRDTTFFTRPNVDGTTIVASGTLVNAGPNTGNVFGATAQGFIEYALGSHVNYEGPIDGVEQTFTHTGTCGVVRVENPQDGTFFLLSAGQSATLINSDKGVGFKLYPNNNGAETTAPSNADCNPGETTSVLIESQSQLFLESIRPDAADETITVEWQAGPTFPKQPVLAWAGMRVALEHNWGVGGECPFATGLDLTGPEGGSFYVLYSKQANPGSPGSFVSDGAYAGDYVAFTNENVIVRTWASGYPQNDPRSRADWDPNSDCISSALIEAQDPGEFDGTAVVVVSGDQFCQGCQPTLANAQPISGTVAFLVYYMKFESVTLSIVDGEREGHNDGPFSNSNPYSTASDVTSLTENVSADVLLRARVKGWFTNSNLSGRPEVIDGANSKPAHRWVMPDDWPVLAGGALANTLRPNYDVMVSPLLSQGGIPDCAGALMLDCDSLSIPGVGGPEIVQNPFVGPFSLVDGPLGNDSWAPSIVGPGDFRQTWGPDGLINSDDAIMPPALVTFNLSGAGFLKPAMKTHVYSGGQNPYYATHIPAEPWINPINPRGGQFLWDSYQVNGVGPNSGLYNFWSAVAKGAAVFSAGGADASKTTAGANKVPTGGFTWIATYSDNHGESMVWLNGDAGLNMSGCQSGIGPDGVSDEPAVVIGIVGHLCQSGELVGTSTVTASADYPDFKKHLPIASNAVNVNWTWGGHKFLTIEDHEIDFMKYLVLHLTDRDGYCGGNEDTGDVSPSLHPVLGENVRFRIDATQFFGLPIEDAALNPVFSNLGLQVDVVTFDTDVPGNPTILPRFVNGIDGECQAWILLSNSLFGLTDVKVTAFDPEGTITWDVIVDISDPTPEEFTYNLVFGWNLIVWHGETGAPATVLGPYLDDISAVYGWNAPTQTWEGFFPSLIGVPLGNTLAQLETGTPYWIYVTNPLGLSFTVTVP
jgi:hypothetical protein